MDTFPDKHLKENATIENHADPEAYRPGNLKSHRRVKTEYIINQAIIWIAIVFIAVFIIKKLL